MKFVIRSGRVKLSRPNLANFILIICCGFLLGVPVWAADLMLPKVYSDQTNVSGWLMSEKLDGVRGYWDGKQLLSKNGIKLYPPAAFIAQMPDFALEGELWGGRGHFARTSSIVTRQNPHDGWLQLRFAIFDVPEASGGFTSRIEEARSWFTTHPSEYAFIIPQTPVRDQDQLSQELQRVEKLGGEGLIVRKPDAPYKTGRSNEILKVKSYQDSEALVVAHLPGKGRNTGKLGALLVQTEDGIQFKIGSGFSDTDRENPPPVGALISFKYYDKYQSGIPKFPSFIRTRADKEL